MKKILCLLFAFFTVAFPSFAQNNAKPFVIPELRDWNGGKGNWTLSEQVSIVIPENNHDQLLPAAEEFSADIKTMFGKNIPVRTGDPKPGDIYISLGGIGSDNDEAYELDIAHNVSVKANKPVGAFWATRTILQLLEQSPELQMPRGKTLDYPKYQLRGFMLDCARKFFTIDFLRDYVKLMAYYKMNTFQIHLNDNGFKSLFGNDWDKTYAAFRLESDTYPGLTAKDGSYTKKEFIDLQKLAERNQVNIIPEIDVPAHSLAFSRYLPEIGSKEYGMDHLDLFNPKTYEFIDGLFKEYLSGDNPVFRGKQVHIGTDEYSNAKKEVVEQFRHFTDHYIRLVERYGKQAVIWGALTHAKGDTPVKSENVLMYLWHNNYAQPKDMIEQGYNVVSIPDGYLYIVPQAGYYYDYLNAKNLYNSWEPSQIGNVKLEDDHPRLKGGMFAIWNDHIGNGISEKDAHHRIFPAMQTLAVKMWTGGGNLIPFEQFEQKRNTLSEGPGINVMGTVKGAKGVVLQEKELAPDSGTKLKEIGYGYKVEFDINVASADKGTILFQSPNAVFYLADPETGKLGFSRDGYLSTFNYAVPVGKTVRLAIEGDSRVTKLYVDGKLLETLDILRVKKNDKDSISLVRTLVFPLQKTGRFNGKITNFTVTVL